MLSYRILTSIGIILLLSSISIGTYAAIPQSYEEYISEVWLFCDSPDRSWAKDNSLVPKIDYPKLNERAINATIAEWWKSKSFSNDEKLRLKSDLDPIKIGEYTGFKTLEVARIAYRTRMNSAFSCAIISSRIKTMKVLQDIINKKIYNKESEIHIKLKKEVDKLQIEVNKLTCNLPKTSWSDQTVSKTEEITVLINTTIHQYCQYRFYLGYLDSNISEKLRDVQEIENKIWKWEGTQIPKNTDEWVNIAPRYHLDLSNEIIRADATLPKAIKSFQEMDQTYGAHVLLTLIYDDYIKLRKALSSYMNISSQLYQKANNAQSTNKS